MSVPTPVTNSVIVDESGSTRKRKSTRKLPAWIQVKPWETFERASGPSDRKAKNAITDATNDNAIRTVASQPAFGSPMRLPTRSSTTAPRAGNAGMTHARSRRFRALIVGQPFNRSTSSALTDWRRRKMATMIASPTATSAAATTRVKNTMT